MEITTTMVIGSVVNLAIFFTLVWYLGRKPLARGLEARTSQTAALLKQAEQQMAEVSEKLAKQKQELGDLQSQVAEIQANGRRLADQLAEEVRAAARQEGEQLRARAQREIEAEIQLARQQLRQQVAREALANAERLLAERLDSGKQRQLIRDFASTIPAYAGNGHGDH